MNTLIGIDTSFLNDEWADLLIKIRTLKNELEADPEFLGSNKNLYDNFILYRTRVQEFIKSVKTYQTFSDAIYEKTQGLRIEFNAYLNDFKARGFKTTATPTANTPKPSGFVTSMIPDMSKISTPPMWVLVGGGALLWILVFGRAGARRSHHAKSGPVASVQRYFREKKQKKKKMEKVSRIAGKLMEVDDL